MFRSVAVTIVKLYFTGVRLLRPAFVPLVWLFSECSNHVCVTKTCVSVRIAGCGKVSGYCKATVGGDGRNSLLTKTMIQL